MAIGRQIKEQMVTEFSQKIENSRVIMVAGAKGLKAGELNELRIKMNESQTECLMIKNTLAALAFKKAGREGLAPFIHDETFYTLSPEDPVGLAKILVEFSRTHQALKIHGGIVDGKIINPAEINQLAILPSREVLLQKVVAGLKAPLYNLIYILEGPRRKFILTLKAMEKGN